ncbi:kelch repeat-containing protein [Nocardia sp. CS682]|uniref:Kelch repeat-containing protein n=1 Tax=Nocardia sp. CS682 TaxID=1047172 RepID=UPI001074CCB5|nr:kelch repeat-containing protein [Nocardia sp. CS682]QBS44353.1 Kelch-like protein 17 [Nocardia sp. CS682]
MSTALDDATDTWTMAGDLPDANLGFENDDNMVALSEEQALLAGGADAAATAIAATALFDPATATWTTAEPMAIGRRLHTVTRLGDGTVLAAGGITGPYKFPMIAVATTERFDPVTGKWSATRTDMGLERCLHTATVLADGRVLVAGGLAGTALKTTNAAELYDPVADSWAPTGSMTDPRNAHRAVLLADGRVLVVGGAIRVDNYNVAPLAFCEVYDPETGKWTPTGSMAVPRTMHQAVLLPDGSVLVVGGTSHGWVAGPVFDKHSLATTERWYPITERWAPAAAMPFGRDRFHAVTLRSGQVLVFGGGDEQSLNAAFTATARYDPYADTWTSAAPMSYGRFDFAATLLSDGRVLAAGGSSSNDLPKLTELYTP